jgi:hypothetical protein
MQTQFGVAARASSPLWRKIEEEARRDAIRRQKQLDEEAARLAAQQEAERERRLREVKRRGLIARWEADYVPPPPRKDIDVAYQTLVEVAADCNVPIEAIRGKTRTRGIVEVRHRAAYEIASKTGLPLSRIGRLLGGRDHTTCHYAILKHALRNKLPLPRGMEFTSRRFGKEGPR